GEGDRAHGDGVAALDVEAGREDDVEGGLEVARVVREGLLGGGGQRDGDAAFHAGGLRGDGGDLLGAGARGAGDVDGRDIEIDGRRADVEAAVDDEVQLLE